MAVKDNICLAGVPMMNGASTLEGYVPDIDATVVARMLDAGGTIIGKARCENLCFSGGSHTSATGPVHNPHKTGYSAGGSSSGSAALVAAGEVDMAIGGDQGGSIRIPASYCGIYGMKPTYGLVPYTGVFPIEATIDHVGPMTATSPTTRCCSKCSPAPTGSTRGRRRQDREATRRNRRRRQGHAIGVVTEGFGHAEIGGRRRRQGQGGRRFVPQAGRHRRGSLGPDASRRHRRSGCRSPPKALPNS